MIRIGVAVVAALSILTLEADGRSLQQQQGKAKDKPLSYASFIISPPKDGKLPVVLVEEQDRFEFPDKKIRFRIFGIDDIKKRKTEKPVTNAATENFGSSNSSNNSSNDISVDEVKVEESTLDQKTGSEASITGPAAAGAETVPTVESSNVTNNASPESTESIIEEEHDVTAAAPLEFIFNDDDYELEVVAKDRFVGSGSAFWFDQDSAVYVADALGGKVYRYKQVEEENTDQNAGNEASPSPSEVTSATEVAVTKAAENQSSSSAPDNNNATTATNVVVTTDPTVIAGISNSTESNQTISTDGTTTETSTTTVNSSFVVTKQIQVFNATEKPLEEVTAAVVDNTTISIIEQKPAGNETDDSSSSNKDAKKRLEKEDALHHQDGSYTEFELDLRNATSGIVGPVVPIAYDPVLSVVTLSIGFDSSFTLKPINWTFTEEKKNFSDLEKTTDFTERERYHKLTFAQKDPLGRLITGSVDVRTGLTPYPCLDYLVLSDSKSGNVSNLFLDEFRREEQLLACRPGGVAFTKKGDMLYVDQITRNLLKFRYDAEQGKIVGTHELLAHNSGGENSGFPTAMALDGGADGKLWIGLSGTGEVMSMDVEAMVMTKTLKFPDREIVDLAIDEKEGHIYVLTNTSLYRLSRRAVAAPATTIGN